MLMEKARLSDLVTDIYVVLDAAIVLFMSNDHQQLMHLLQQHVNISPTTVRSSASVSVRQ